MRGRGGGAEQVQRLTIPRAAGKASPRIAKMQTWPMHTPKPCTARAATISATIVPTCRQ